VQTVFLWRVRRKIFNSLLKLTAQILFIPHFLMFLNQEISVLPQKEEKQKKVEKPRKKHFLFLKEKNWRNEMEIEPMKKVKTSVSQKFLILLTETSFKFSFYFIVPILRMVKVIWVNK
jgi:hypothetical protein